jgi:hypothetical protein
MALGNETEAAEAGEAGAGREEAGEMEGEIAGVMQSYCEGLQWTAHYYFSGLASWGWYHFSNV